MASLTDKITDVRNGARPISARVITARSIGGTTLHCNALTGWPTASKVHFVTYQIDASSNPIDGTQLDCVGIVSGADITQFTVLDGTDGGSSVGDVVEMLPTASWGQDLADALTREHYRDGTHENINADSVTTGTLNTSAFHSATKSLIFEQIYPVGSIYINASVSTNPATLLGFGTWTAFGSGRVPVGYNASDSNFNAAEKTGGALPLSTFWEYPVRPVSDT